MKLAGHLEGQSGDEYRNRFNNDGYHLTIELPGAFEDNRRLIAVIMSSAYTDKTGILPMIVEDEIRLSKLLEEIRDRKV